MVIYIITNLVNGKIYIGQDSKNRSWYFGSGAILNLAIKKYGKENFRKEILELCASQEQLNEREVYWIKFYNSRDRKIGYNISEGGGGCKGYKHKESFIKKISVLRKDPVWMANQKKSIKPYVSSPEMNKKNSDSQKGLHTGSKNPMSKKFQIISPAGDKFIVEGGLNNFCKEKKLSTRLMIRVNQGLQDNHKGWRIKETK